MSELLARDLDWNRMWQQARQKKTWRSKTAADWDRKAPGFARRTASSVYTKRFLSLLNADRNWSILDVGCGPGTLAMPLARNGNHVSALDFSSRMLAVLETQAHQEGLDNITAYNTSWEDDWQALGIQPHDVAIASRSLAVIDLKAALEKLSRYATHMVAITDRVKYGPFDPHAFAAVGRTLESGPDYMYTVNLLSQMGFLPTINYIRLEKRLLYDNIEEALSSYTWMFKDLTDQEQNKLRAYVNSIITVEQDGRVTVHRKYVPTWAFICWSPTLTMQ